MPEAVARILSNLNALSSEVPAELAYAFVSSLEPGEDEGADEAWRHELSRRVQEIRSGQVFGNPASKLFEELRAQRR